MPPPGRTCHHQAGLTRSEICDLTLSSTPTQRGVRLCGCRAKRKHLSPSTADYQVRQHNFLCHICWKWKNLCFSHLKAWERSKSPTTQNIQVLQLNPPTFESPTKLKHSCNAFEVPSGQHFINKLPISEENTPVIEVPVCITTHHILDSLSNRLHWCGRELNENSRIESLTVWPCPYYCILGKQEALSPLFSEKRTFIFSTATHRADETLSFT